MMKHTQFIEEKAFAYKTLGPSDLQETTQFMVQNIQNFEAMKEEDRTRIYAMTRCILIPVLHHQWSYGLIMNKKIVGVSLNLDILDYMKILNTIEDHSNFNDIIDIFHFTTPLKEILEKANRGDYVVCLASSINDNIGLSSLKKELKIIFQGFLICKVGGWKNMLFSTRNPVPFLKINSQVICQSPIVQQRQKQYLLKLCFENFMLGSSPFKDINAKL